MRKTTIIALVILTLAGAGLLAWALLSRRTPQPPAANNAANNTANVPLVNKSPVVPDTISANDEAAIADVAKHFLFQFGTYDETTHFRNINGATYFAEATLRTEMVAFADQQRATGKTLPSSTTGSLDVAQIVVEKVVATGTTPIKIVAHVTGSTSLVTAGRGVTNKFSGELRMVKVGDFWFVSDMAFTPPLLGFK